MTDKTREDVEMVARCLEIINQAARDGDTHRAADHSKWLLERRFPAEWGDVNEQLAAFAVERADEGDTRAQSLVSTLRERGVLDDSGTIRRDE